jgi:peptide/nickel transport system ATP-binding protein
MLEATGLTKSYGGKSVLSGASFHIDEGELVSIMGPSGEGKSTIARILCGTVKADSGDVTMMGRSVFSKGKFLPEFRRLIQLIPQQPFASLDPRQTVGDAIAEPLLYYRLVPDKKAARQQARQLLERVLLSPSLYGRRPGELSGGQAQRVLIARSLTVSPRLLIADEATSMLDVSSQAQIVKILRGIVKDSGISILFISHDTSLVQAISNRIYCLENGKTLLKGSSQ